MGQRIRPNNINGLSRQEREAGIAKPQPAVEEPQPLSPEQQAAARQAAREEADRIDFIERNQKVKLPKNPVAGRLDQSSFNFAAKSAANLPRGFAEIAEFILKATKAEEDSLKKLKLQIDDFEKKTRENPVIDFTPIAGLVDLLTGSNLAPSMRPRVSQEEKEKDLLDLKERLAVREANLSDRKLRLTENFIARSSRFDLEEFKNSNKAEQLRLKDKLDKETIRLKAELARKEKQSPRDLDEKIKLLNASEKNTLFKEEGALDALMDMKKALALGDTTFSLVGDNRYTEARARFAEDLGRLQSGGAINEGEEKRFLLLVPEVRDFSEIQEIKLNNMIERFRSNIRNRGIDPDALLKRRNIEQVIREGAAPPVVDIELKEIDDEIKQIDAELKSL